MEVASFIREYLYKQDYLDVPGLGTFFLSKDPFSVDNPQNKIKPSVKTLIFRENTRVSGESLIHFIARRKQIGLEEAKTSIFQFTNEIRTLIKRKGSADILGFGKFISDDGIHLDFKAHPNNYSAISFGLGELNLPPLEKAPDPSLKIEKPIFSDYKVPGLSTGENLNAPSLNDLYSIPASLKESTQTPTENPEINDHEKREFETKSNPFLDTPLVSPVESILEEHSVPGVQEQNIPDPNADQSHLPTAEELYKTYHFTPENVYLDQHPSEINRETAPVSEIEEIKPVLEEDHNRVLGENPGQVLESPSKILPEEDFKTEIKESSPLLENPLSYPLSENLRLSPVKDANLGIQHPPVFEPLLEDADNQGPLDNSRGFIWVWIVSTLFLVATLTGLAYIERSSLLKNIHKTFPDFKAFDFLEPKKKIEIQDSGLVKNPNLILTDSLKSKLLSDSIRTRDSLKRIQAPDSNKSVLGNTLSPTTEINIKSIKESGQFLVIGADYYRLENAKKFGTENFGKKGIPYFIVDASGQHLFIKDNKPVKYFVCLGEYTDISIAELKIQELLKDPKFTGFAKPYVYKNKFKNP